MQAWNQWGAPAAAASYQGYTAPPPPTTAPAAPPVAAGTNPYSLGYHQYYSTPPLPGATPDFSQWTALQQQQWQQWQTWQQQFQQWQQQYGDKYQETMTAMMAATGATAPTTTASTVPAPPPGAPPDINQPPPLPPADPKAPVPPPPPDDRSTDPYSAHNPYSAVSTDKNQDVHGQSAYGGFFTGGPFSVPPPSVPPPPSGPPPSHPVVPNTHLPPPAPPPQQPPLPTNVPPPPTGVPPPPAPKGQDDYSKGYASGGSGKRPYDQDQGYQTGNHDSGVDTSKKPRNDSYSQNSYGPEDKPGNQRWSGANSSGSGPGSTTGSTAGTGAGAKGDQVSQRISKDQPPQDNPDELLAAEKTFDIQFKHWEEQFAKWKEQNINHPDKVQYREYEAKWEAWKENLLQRRTQMRKKREAAIRQQQLQQQQSQPPLPQASPQGSQNQDSQDAVSLSGQDSIKQSTDAASQRGGRRQGAGTPGSASGYFSGDVQREEAENSQIDKPLDSSMTSAAGFNFAAVGGGFAAQAAAENDDKGFKDSPRSQSSNSFLSKLAEGDKSKDGSQADDGEKQDFIGGKAATSGGIPGLDLLSEGKIGSDVAGEKEEKAKEEDRALSIGHDKDERDHGFIGPMRDTEKSNQSSADKSSNKAQPEDKSPSKTSFNPGQTGGPMKSGGLLGVAPNQHVPSGVQGFGPGGFGPGQNAGPGGFRGQPSNQGPPGGGNQGLLAYPGPGGYQNQPNFPGPPPMLGQPQGPPGFGGNQPYGGGPYGGMPPNQNQNQNFRPPGGPNFGPNSQNFGPGSQGFGPGNRGPGGNFNQGPMGGNTQSGYGTNNQPFGGQQSNFSSDKGMNSQQGSFGGPNNSQGLLGGPGGQGGNPPFGNRGGFGQGPLNNQAFGGNNSNNQFGNLNPQAFNMAPPGGNQQNFGNKAPSLLGTPPKFGGPQGGSGPGGFGLNQGSGPSGANQGSGGPAVPGGPGGPAVPGGPGGPSGPGGPGGPGGAGGLGGSSASGTMGGPPSGQGVPGSPGGLGGPGGQGSGGGAPGGPSSGQSGSTGGPSLLGGPPFGGLQGNWKEGDKGGWNPRDGPGRDGFPPGGRDGRDNFSRDFHEEGFAGGRDNFDSSQREGGFFGGGVKDRFGEPGGPGREFDRAGPGQREDRDYRGEFDGRGGRGGRGRGGFGGWQGDRGMGGRGGGPGGSGAPGALGGPGGPGGPSGAPGGRGGRFRDEVTGMDAPPSLLGDGPGVPEGPRPWERNLDKDDAFNNRDRWMDDGPKRFQDPPPPKGWLGGPRGDNRPWSGGRGDGRDGRGDDRFGARGPWDRAPDWEKLEPATIVDYGHKPAAGDTLPPGNTFAEPVQTFDYGHGSSARRPDVPPSTVGPGGPSAGRPDPWRRDDPPPPSFRGGRERDDRFHRGDRDRDWGRGGGGGGGGIWEHEREFGKGREPNRWERDREMNRPRSDIDLRERERERERDRDRDRERERDRDRDRERDREEKGRWGGDDGDNRGRAGERWGRDRREKDFRQDHRSDHRSSDRDADKEWNGSRSNDRSAPEENFPPPPDAPPPPSFAPVSDSSRAVLIEDLLCPPGRATRPARLVMILRGPPGSGKTFVAKLIKDKEVEMGGSAPRILCLDDYFMVEMEKEDKDPETGRKITTKVMEYEYEAGMDKHYRSSLVKAFRKTVLDGYFPFIIVDCINDKVKHFEEMWSFAKQKGFQVYICEMDMDGSTCTKRNIHNRSEKDIMDIIKNWEETPKHYLRVDVRSLLQSVAITEVEMEDTTVEEGQEGEGAPEDAKAADAGGEGGGSGDGQEGDEEMVENPFTSKWDQFEPTGDKLDRLDGLARKRNVEENPKTLDDWLQLTDDYDRRGSTKPGQKRVRWADLEERRQQEKMRAIGFVVGQTDWSRMTDPTYGEGALTQTKYI